MVQNPATLEVLAEVPDATPAQINAAVARANDALAGPWSAVDTRKQALADIADLMERETEVLAASITAEQGKPLLGAQMEVATAIRIARYYAGYDPRAEVIRDTGREKVFVDHIPLGVAGLIVPWNFPITILFMKLGPTLRAGNTVVIKPAPTTPLTTLWLVEQLQTLLPKGVIQVVTGGGDVGAALCAHPGVAKLSFTGSTATGRKVMGSSAETLKRLTLELGGNDPVILLDDTDVERAAGKLAMSIFSGAAGQICQAAKRVYVHQSIHDDFVDAMRDIAGKVVVGDGAADGTMMGPLHTAQQRDFVQALLDDAASRGAEVWQDGPPLPNLPGHFIRPAVVSGIDPDAPLVMQEQFGPALPIVAFDEDAQAARMANAGEYGLDASVWSADPARALTLAQQLRAGSLFVNSHALPPDPELPFGGAKQSGFGAELGDWGFDDASQRRLIRIEHLDPVA